MTKFAQIAALFALAGALALGIPNVANAQNSQGQNNNDQGGARGAPGPIAGAGLPILAVGYGVYWLVRRRRKAP
ncbi:hypothetical protein [Bradyrhizobium sp. UFLA05-112]